MGFLLYGGNKAPCLKSMLRAFGGTKLKLPAGLVLRQVCLASQAIVLLLCLVGLVVIFQWGL